MINENFIFLALVFNFLSSFSYLKAVIEGKAKPHKVTWFLWALAPLIGFLAQWSQGVGLISLMTFAIFLGPALIFGASFLNKKSDWKITKFDLFCGSISLLAIVIWFLTKDAMLALILSIVADAIACIPTLIKSWYFPETEDPQAYVFSATSAFITTLSIQTWNFQTYGFPVWTFLICIVFILLVRFKIGRMLQE